MHLSSCLYCILLCAGTQFSISLSPRVPRRLGRSYQCVQMMQSNAASAILPSALIFSEDDPILQASRMAAFERLQTTVESLADFQGSDSVKLIHNGDINEKLGAIPINSLLFQVSNLPDPILIIASSSNRVSIKKLEAYLEQGDDDERVCAYLAPSDKVEQLCGFPPKSVPPIGHGPRAIRTIIDVQLTESNGLMLVGGGGHPTISCRIAVETLLKLEGTEIADLGSRIDGQSSLIGHDETDLLDPLFLKPFFPIAPPDTETAEYVIRNPDKPNPLKPQSVTIVGRVNGVRRMARRLVFCDLAPPNYVGTGSSKVDSYDLPWKSGTDGMDMAVQLIAGKTFCKQRGELDGPTLLKLIKPGQLVLVEGKTNVGNRESLGHWVEKRSLDIVVWNYQILELEPIRAVPVPPPKVEATFASRAGLRRQQLSKQDTEAANVSSNSNYLKLSDILQQPTITVVDSLDGVASFDQALKSLSSSKLNINGNSSPVSMVGIDCEWKPSFMISSPSEPQPVLLLQISLHTLQKVYLLDLQTLLRPCLSPCEPMNDVESATSISLEYLLSSAHFLKLGFQLLADLRRLVGSYPHIEAFRVVHSVVEVSGVAQKSMQLAKIRNSRQMVSSLSRLTEYLLNKPLDKEQQISDWSRRPLWPEQEEYASLDAAVMPILFEKALRIADVDWVDDGLRIGRWKDDASFIRSISSVRFVFLEIDDPAVVRKLKAQRIVSDHYIITQSWVEGHDEPSVPSVPIHGAEGPYTDSSGTFRIPSLGLNLTRNLDGNRLANLVGQRLGKSKESCLEALFRGNVDLPEGAKLEYPQRSGYVEFGDGMALFVNMPLRPGDPSPRGYPNVWLNEGSSMTWFLRENEWNQGTSRIAKKLLGCGINGESVNKAVLFVRMGRGDFLCCGRCRVAQNERTNVAVTDRGLVEVCLDLLDWKELQNVEEFTSMTTDMVKSDDSDDASIVIHEVSPFRLARKIIQGNMVGAMGLVLLNVPESQQSIELGLKQLELALRSVAETPEIKCALEKLSQM
jgi:prolyl-tRNA editing enzyme YbaK/EbsC (Cys-tRNA(Pro) deacylase)